MSYIESAKTYTGNTLDTIFFRPMLSGPSATDLGVKVLYNMPMPTTIQLWSGQKNILQSFTQNGWNGGNSAIKEQKTIKMNRVKAEMGFSAADYFSLVFENIAARSDVNMEDLTGTELEAAETELFSKSIAESIRATMWLGEYEGSSDYNTFDGFLPAIYSQCEEGLIPEFVYTDQHLDEEGFVINCFERAWINSYQELKDLKNDGNLVYFVSSDIYHLYELYLDSKGTEGSYIDLVNGHKTLSYHGIPVVDIHVSSYTPETDLPDSFCLLTDRRNLVMAVNTADFPGAEVRMWYNPDEMENRQRAVFMAGCDLVDPKLISVAYYG